MFRHEGAAREPILNALVAGYLAAIAGLVNTSGFVVLGTFSAHVTGTVGRVSVDLGTGDLGSALFALLLVVSFFVGAFLASLVIEGSSARVPEAYASALFVQAGLLALFVLVNTLMRPASPRALDAQAALLCCAMGMQNSLVTRLSGAVVRTTHLTGVVTDLGIEAARWYRWHRARLGLAPLFRGRVPPARPAAVKSLLLLTIVLTFSLGALLGALLAIRVGGRALGLAALATLALGVYARSQRHHPSHPPPRA